MSTGGTAERSALPPAIRACRARPSPSRWRAPSSSAPVQLPGFREILLALKMERETEQDEILVSVEQSFFGSHAYGIMWRQILTSTLDD